MGGGGGGDLQVTLLTQQVDLGSDVQEDRGERFERENCKKGPGNSGGSGGVGEGGRGRGLS